jgi:hypothetical protein
LQDSVTARLLIDHYDASLIGLENQHHPVTVLDSLPACLAQHSSLLNEGIAGLHPHLHADIGLCRKNAAQSSKYQYRFHKTSSEKISAAGFPRAGRSLNNECENRSRKL